MRIARPCRVDVSLTCREALCVPHSFSWLRGWGSPPHTHTHIHGAGVIKRNVCQLAFLSATNFHQFTSSVYCHIVCVRIVKKPLGMFLINTCTGCDSQLPAAWGAGVTRGAVPVGSQHRPPEYLEGTFRSLGALCPQHVK